MKNKILTFIKNNKLYTLIIAIIILTAGFFIIRPQYNFDALSSLKINNDNSLSKYINIENNTILYSYEKSASDNSKTIKESTDTQEINNEFENGNGNNIVTARVPNMPYGVYTLNIDYLTDYNTDTENKPVVYFSLTEGKEETYEFSFLPLVNYRSAQSGLIFVTNPLGTNWKYEEGEKQMVSLNMNVSGAGKCTITSLKIKEYTPWKFGVILFELLILFAVFLAKSFCKNNDDSDEAKTLSKIKSLTVYGMIVLVLFASFPAFTGVMKSFCVENHDYMFHTNRIASIAAELENGNFPVIYQPDVLFGTGYISNIMYGKLLFYIPAILHILGMPLATAHNAYTVVINALTAIIALYSFYGIFKNKKLAALGTVLYTLSSYRICAVYLRAAVGEYTAMTFFPLLVYGLYKIYFEKNEDKGTNDSKAALLIKEMLTCLPLLFAASGIIQSHVLTIVMLIPFIILFALVHIKTTIKKLPTLICLSTAIILTNANFIVPFLDEYTKPLMVNERGFTDNLTKFGTKFYQVFSLFMTNGGIAERNTSQGSMPLTIGGALVFGIVLFISVLVISKNENFENLLAATECFIYGMICILLSSVYFPWIVFALQNDKISSILTSINLPWRYLEFSSVLLTVCTVYAVKQLSDKDIQMKYFKTTINIGLIIASFSVVVIGAFFTNFMNENPLIKVTDTKSFYVQDVWYLPKGTDTSAIYDNKPTSSEKMSVVYIGNNNKGKRIYSIRKDSESDIKIIDKFNKDYDGVEITLPVIYYNFLSVKDNKTGKTIESFAGTNNYIAFNVDENFDGEITLEYGLRPIWKVGYIISLISVILIISFIMLFVVFKNNKFTNNIIKN